jgi:hypothetical protein
VGVKCGNSCLGTTPALLAAGVPNDAFKPFEGDEKAVATELRKRNQRERAGQLTLEDEVARAESELWEHALAIERTSDSSLDELLAKEQRYRQFVESPPYAHARLLADAWCAAFVQRKTGDTPVYVTAATLRVAAEAPALLPHETRAEIEALRKEYAFFHWHVEFPQVFRVPEHGESENEQAGWSGGFDCVLGNPPWEQEEITEDEFFASVPAIAGARNKAAKTKLIAALELDDPALFHSFRGAQRRSAAIRHLVQASGRYPLSARGRINTYAIFAELMLSAISARGRVGCILPLGIATDDTKKHFFGHLVRSRSLVSLFGFENEELIFPGVHHAFRFCLVTISGAARPVGAADLVFFARRVDALREPERRFTLTAADFQLLNPNTRTCPIFRSRRDADLAKEIYRRVPVVIDESRGDDGNPWAITFRQGLFNMASDSGVFSMKEQLEDEGWCLDGNVFSRGDAAYVPLYEGKMIHQFDHRFGTYDAQTEAQARQGKLPELTNEQHADPELLPRPRYWVLAAEVDSQLRGKWDRDWLLGWRDITGTEKVRTAIASVVPRVGAAHNLPLIFMATRKYVAQLLANIDSFVFDYSARQKVGGTHLTFFVIEQLPILPPGCADDVVPDDWIARRVLELTYTAWDIQPFARDLGYDGPPFRWDADRRFLLRCELDAAFFHLYGLAHDDVDYVMDTFPIVRDRDVKAHGEYRTKRMILKIYDELARSKETAQPYETRLDPGPADPRVAHLPRPDDVVTPVGA